MYIVIVLLTMLVLPVASIFIQNLTTPSAPLVATAMAWFVFWAFGIRLFVAGWRQTLQPSFTAKVIFELEDPKSYIVVRELGFANIAFGTAGIVSLWLPTWQPVCAVLGTIFYGAAGIQHIFRKKNGTEWLAMVSDLYAAILFLAAAWYSLTR